MTSTLLTNFKQRIKTLELIPSGGGCFEVTVNGKLVYSKLETGTFPEEQWVVDTLEAQANK